MTKIVTIVGARPQFIKSAAVSRLLSSRAEEIIIHTGQHYDDNMSDVFFRELQIPLPEYNLHVGSGLHGAQTGEMLARIEQVLLDERPDAVLVYGDTNSTLAGALAASKLHIQLSHVEAGLRSYNREMPEEINRVLADHVSDLLFCPSENAVKNLMEEGITNGVFLVGDVMADSLFFASQQAESCSNILSETRMIPKKYLLATVHRASNTDNVENLKKILEAFVRIDEPIIFPVHPRTRKNIQAHQLDKLVSGSLVNMIDPVGYVDMVCLENSAKMILTDSGGIQKEAYWLEVPCVTLRTETEWVETVNSGWNRLAGVEINHIVEAVKSFNTPSSHPVLYGDGRTAQRIIDIILSSHR